MYTSIPCCYNVSAATAALIFIALVVAGCGTSDSIRDRNSPTPSEGMQFEWGVLENGVDGTTNFASELIFRNQGSETLPDEGWTLFFNFGRAIDTSTVTPTVRIDHINGDFYRLRPTERFTAIAPGSRTRITFIAAAWAISKSDLPDGFYFVWGDEETGVIDAVGDPAVLPFTEKKQVQRRRGDHVPIATAEHLFEENLSLHEVDDVPPILPRPQSLSTGPGTVTIDPSMTIAHARGLASEAAYLADALEHTLGARPSIAETSEGSVVLSTDTSLPAEGYTLRADESGIRITGGSGAGVFYGIQSLRALFPIDVYRAPTASFEIIEAQVEDAPRFSYRGMHLDVARNFQPVEEIKKLLDLMSFYKLNKFHFHLSDDEGWRLPIEELPELTSVGGRRGHTLTAEDHLVPHHGSGPYPDSDSSQGSGFYTREQFEDILRYAQQRHIDVIPEIDLPGHARAAIVAMHARARRLGNDEYLLSDPLDSSEYRSVQMFEDNVINVCLPSTYRFIETVVNDVVEMYAEADVPLRAIHTGGDEVPPGVWEESPACEELIRREAAVNSTAGLHDYFLRRFDEILGRHGLITAGWEEIGLMERNGTKEPHPAFADSDFRPYVWNAVWGWGGEENVYKLANAGYNVVISNAGNFYFDFAYAKHPEEPGMYWGGFVDTKAPFAFIPFDLYKSAGFDLMGRPIADTAYAHAERLTLAGRERVLGLQGQLWGEHIKSTGRLEFMIFPRLISLAERAWAERPGWAMIADTERRERMLADDWNVFSNALGRRELPRLDHLHGGVHYRIPPPGAVIESGVLRANVAHPGLEIRYTMDGTMPTAASPLYTGPMRADGPVKLRAFNTTGRGSRTVSVTAP